MIGLCPDRAVRMCILVFEQLCCCFLQKELDSELKDNDAEQERLQGSSLVYGETIQVGKQPEAIEGLEPCSSFHLPEEG